MSHATECFFFLRMTLYSAGLRKVPADVAASSAPGKYTAIVKYWDFCCSRDKKLGAIVQRSCPYL